MKFTSYLTKVSDLENKKVDCYILAPSNLESFPL